MNICVFVRDNGACGEYRVNTPFGTLSHTDSDIKVTKIEKGDSQDTIYDGLADADVILFPRVCEPHYIKIMKGLQADGKKVVVDYDDNMFNISPLSPHYEELGTEEVVTEFNGEPIKLWEDGKNINLEENKVRIQAVKDACKIADMVTVTQPILADVYKEFNSNVKCLPNCVDLKIWNKLPLEKTKLTLGWGGGSSHYEDMCLITDALVQVMQKYPKLELTLVGMQFQGVTKQLPKNRVHFLDWCPTPAHPYRMAGLGIDIGLVPLVDNEFNRCKSAIKWIEYSALEIPSVVSHVSPYKEEHKGNNAVFVENTTDAWVSGISALIKDENLRAKIGKNAYKSVERKFDINTQCHQWGNVYRGLL